jgi:hypothetical protein
MRRPTKEMKVGRGRRVLFYCAVVIGVGSTGVWYLNQGTEPVRAARSSAPTAIPVTVAVATRRDSPIYLTDQAKAKRMQHKLRVDSHVTVNEPLAPGPALAKRDRSS